MNSLTKYFEFIEAQDEFLHQRQEIALPMFNELRSKMNSIILNLKNLEDDESDKISNAMRAHLFSMLIAPVQFDLAFRDAFNFYGDPVAFNRRWGLSGELEDAIHLTENLLNSENPMRIQLAECIHKALSEEKNIKIFCDRKSRQHFESLDSSFTEQFYKNNTFHYSVREYEFSEPFDILIKVGPLRSKGYGAIPDAIKSAPKFKNLRQFVWSGCLDDPNFGYDPAAAISSILPSINTSKKNIWTNIITKVGDWNTSAKENFSNLDEFSMFANANRNQELRRAILFEIFNSQAVIYPFTETISFDPNSADNLAVDLRIPGESLIDGMFLIEYKIADIDFGKMQAQVNGYCEIWKKRLADELKTNSRALCLSLEERGLNLQNLHNCLHYWAQPPTSVVHAPQSLKHFKVLIEKLDIDSGIENAKENNSKPWWKKAWDEIRVSRGKASQAGRQESQIIEEEILDILNMMTPEIRHNASSTGRFQLSIPPGCELKGVFYFYKIEHVETGFIAPDSEFRIVRPLHFFNQWKVS
jgi:hypothetical protein